MIIIDLKDYGVFPVEIKEIFSKDKFDLNDFFCGLKSDIKLSAAINKANNYYIMDFSFNCLAGTECARCLKPIDLNIEKKEKVFLFDKSFEKISSEIIDLEEDEFDHYYIRDLVFNLTDFINEQLIISLPAKAVCSDDCRGLCPVCGEDLNRAECGCIRESTDPRWDRLKSCNKNQVSGI